MKRFEGLEKLTGRTLFIDDLPLENCLWGATVRSPAARGTIRQVRVPNHLEGSGLVLVDHRDLPGPNVVSLITDDWPILAAETVRHRYEPVMLVAAESRAAARRAAAQIEVVVDPLPAALDFRQTPTAEQIQVGDDNVLKQLKIERGEVDEALAAAPIVVEGEYETGAQEHVYLEPQGMAAWLDGEVVVVHGSLQCPYYVESALTRALDLPAERVRVIQAATGGGFGGKEDFPSIVAIHAALLAIKAQRPIKLIYDRGEDMAATTKRHPAWIRHRTGLSEEGQILAHDIEVVLDGGAYVTLSPVVLSRGMIHAAGPYACDHVRIRGRAMMTNSVPFGAFRGFGAPQTLFAIERHMDVIAKQIGVDPVKLRRLNLLTDGQATATGQVIDDGTDRQQVLSRALDLSRFTYKRSQHTAFNAEHAYLRRGIGLACFFHGAGFTGSGERAMKSLLHVAGLADGRVEVLSASTEIGQGTTTIFTQIAADQLRLDPEQILIAQPDTWRVPDNGPTVASRTTMVVGRLIERACDNLRERVGLDAAATGTELQAALVAWHEEHPDEELLGSARYQQPPGIEWDDETYRGDAYSAYGWATYVAEVEVDLRTYTARVIDFVAVQEIGKVLNETLARGQIQGGVVQGIGWALLEECRWQEGGMANHQLTNYIIPTSDDVPSIRVAFLENPYPHGGQGAKGIGELPLDGPAPAIFNAVAAATGVDPRVLPLVPERLMELIEQ